MIDRQSSDGRRSVGVRLLTIAAFALASGGCSKAGQSDVLRVEPDFTGSGSISYVQSDKTVHCFPAQRAKSYHFTGLLHNTGGGPVEVSEGGAGPLRISFVRPGTAGIDASLAATYIAPHGQVPFYGTIKASGSGTAGAAVSVDRFAFDYSYGGRHYHRAVQFPYDVRAEIPDPGSQVCTPKS